MRRVSRLRRLELHAATKFARLRRRIGLLRLAENDAGIRLDEHQVQVELSQQVINLQSYWSNWCRAYFMSGTLGTLSVTGTTVASALNLASEQDALLIAKHGRIHPNAAPVQHYQEPKWFDPNVLSNAVQSAQWNTAVLTNQLLNSAPPGLAHLRAFRNYYAHRSEHLRSDALAIGPSYLVGLARRPSEILLFVEPGRSVTVIERWILDLGRFTGALCQ